MQRRQVEARGARREREWQYQWLEVELESVSYCNAVLSEPRNVFMGNTFSESFYFYFRERQRDREARDGRGTVVKVFIYFFFM